MKSFTPTWKCGRFFGKQISGSWYLCRLLFFLYWFSLFETYRCLVFYFQSFCCLLVSLFYTYHMAQKAGSVCLFAFQPVDTWINMFWFGEVFSRRQLEIRDVNIFWFRFMLYILCLSRSFMNLSFYWLEWSSPEFPNLCFSYFTGVVISPSLAFCFAPDQKAVFIIL